MDSSVSHCSENSFLIKDDYGSSGYRLCKYVLYPKQSFYTYNPYTYSRFRTLLSIELTKMRCEGRNGNPIDVNKITGYPTRLF